MFTTLTPTYEISLNLCFNILLFFDLEEYVLQLQYAITTIHMIYHTLYSNDFKFYLNNLK